jgi:SepF-like predicted cell division protein (DUF552 family)
MTDRDEACGRLLGSLEDAISILEKGKEACVLDDWEIFPVEEVEEIIEQLRDMVERLNVEIAEIADENEGE